MTVTFFEKRFTPVILLQNVEHLVVFVCKTRAFHVQQFLNDEALNLVRGVWFGGGIVWHVHQSMCTFSSWLSCKVAQW